MPRSSEAYLWDAGEAIRAIQSFVLGRTGDDYAGDKLLRSGVERQLQIVGEALNQFARHDPQRAGRIADLPRIVAFRNILVHGYARVDDSRVWNVVHEQLPALLAVIVELLGDEPP